MAEPSGAALRHTWAPESAPTPQQKRMSKMLQLAAAKRMVLQAQRNMVASREMLEAQQSFARELASQGEAHEAAQAQLRRRQRGRVLDVLSRRRRRWLMRTALSAWRQSQVAAEPAAAPGDRKSVV